jgi:hypothetical protein
VHLRVLQITRVLSVAADLGQTRSVAVHASSLTKGLFLEKFKTQESWVAFFSPKTTPRFLLEKTKRLKNMFLNSPEPLKERSFVPNCTWVNFGEKEKPN